MSKVISYDNVVEGGGNMRLDENNHPIVVEGKLITTANVFEKAIEEDKVVFDDRDGVPTMRDLKEGEEVKDIPGFEGTMDQLNNINVNYVEEPILPGLDPKIKSATIYSAEVKETKNTRKYTDKEMQKIVDNLPPIPKHIKEKLK